MSSTRMLLIDQKEGTCTEFMEYHNSHGSAPVIWDIFSEKYWKKDKHAWLMNNELKDFWNLYKDTNIPLAHRAVFCMTFDRALITRVNYGRSIDDIEKFIQDFSDYPGFWIGANHWPKIIFDIVKVDKNTTAPEIGFHMTTVTENPCVIYDDNGDYRLHEDLYDLYAELDGVSK